MNTVQYGCILQGPVQAEAVKPSIDAIQEFKISTNSFSAEYGRATGGVVNVTIKSGTNEIHGSAFEIYQSPKFISRSPFNQNGTGSVEHDPGWSFGGPVFLPKLYDGRRKTFWMFTYEVTRRRQAVSSTVLVPSLAERAGDFSQVNSPGLQIVDPLSKTPFPNNIIPQGRINPIGAALAKLYPVPNSADPARNYFGTPEGLSDNNVPSTRVDHQLSSKDTLW